MATIRTNIQARMVTPPVASGTARVTAGATGVPRLDIVGYTGGTMMLAGWRQPVVVDLTSLRLPALLPILYDHVPDLEFIVGQADRIRVAGGRLLLSGPALGTSDRAKQVIALGRAGMALQASIGANPGRLMDVPAGESVTVNGRSFDGPVTVAYDSELMEVSVVVLGADRGGTSTSVAGQRPAPQKAGRTLTPANKRAAAALIYRQIVAGKYRKCTPAELAAVRAHAARLARS